MTTARSIIYASMRKGGITTKGETPSADEASDGLQELNSMLGMWSNNNMLIYVRVNESFTLTPSDNEYTIGSGANFNTTRPVFIVGAFIRDGSDDYPMDIISDSAYLNITSKSLLGMPESLNYNNNYPNGTIKIHPSPQSAYALHILSEKPLTTIATLDTELSFPPGWEDAIMYNLTKRLMPEYGQEPSGIILDLADDGKNMIERTIRRNQSMDWNAASSSQNIYTGYWN